MGAPCPASGTWDQASSLESLFFVRVRRKRGPGNSRNSVKQLLIIDLLKFLPLHNPSTIPYNPSTSPYNPSTIQHNPSTFSAILRPNNPTPPKPDPVADSQLAALPGLKTGGPSPRQVRVGKCNPPEGRAAQNFSRSKLSILAKKESRLRAQIRMTPAVGNNPRNILLRIEPVLREHGVELLATPFRFVFPRTESYRIGRFL